MASNIAYTTIDETFPVAGKDNDSQGFRDNFGIIKNSFQAAKGEIEAIQLNGAVKNAANDFATNNILRANFVNCTEGFFDGGVVNSTTLIDYTLGSYQTFQVTGNMSFTITNLPAAGKLGKLSVHLTGDGTPRTVTFNISTGSFKKSSRVPGTITVTSSTDPRVFTFWTYNGSNTVLMDYLGDFT
jgi:hypothetical protein